MNPISIVGLGLAVILIAFALTKYFVNYHEALNYCEKCGKAALRSEWLPCKYNTTTGKPAIVERLVWCEQHRNPTPPIHDVLPLPAISQHVGHDWKDIHVWQYSHWNAIERKRA